MICPGCENEVEISVVDDCTFKCSNENCIFHSIPLNIKSVDIIKSYDNKLQRYKVKEKGRLAYVNKKERSVNPYKDELKGYWDNGWQSEKEKWDNVKKVTSKQEIIEFYEEKIGQVKENLKGLYVYCNHFLIRGKRMKEKLVKVANWIDGVLD